MARLLLPLLPLLSWWLVSPVSGASLVSSTWASTSGVLNHSDFGFEQAQHQNPYRDANRKISNMFTISWDMEKEGHDYRPSSDMEAFEMDDGVAGSSSVYEEFEDVDGEEENNEEPIEDIRSEEGSIILLTEEDMHEEMMMQDSSSGNTAGLMPRETANSLMLADSKTGCKVVRSCTQSDLKYRGMSDRNSQVSLMTMVWGQVIDHDLEITPQRLLPDGSNRDCCARNNRLHEDCCPVLIEFSDHFFGKRGRPGCLPVLRSKIGPFPCQSPHSGSDVINGNTAWIDASFVYGSDPQKAKNLRLFHEGQMKASVKGSRSPTGNTLLYPPVSVSDDAVRMQFGDHRGDVHPGFTLIAAVFLRNHNRIAHSLSHLRPEWSDEQLYQETRKINIALIQHITYTEFLPVLLGSHSTVPVTEGVNTTYKDDVDGSINMAFATAGYRLHTFVPDRFEFRNRHYQLTSSILLRNLFHDFRILIKGNNFDDLLRGLSAQPIQRFNNIFSGEMTEWLFPAQGQNFGQDIATLNIQRGRDHLIQGYTAYRENCGLGRVDNWNDLFRVLPRGLAELLRENYARPEDIDLYVGSNMEEPIGDSILGHVNHCLVTRQFRALRDGDRFFYTHSGQFSSSQLAAIQSQSLATLLCANSDDPESMMLPRNMMFVSSQRGRNRRFRCDDSRNHPMLDLSPWA